MLDPSVTEPVSGANAPPREAFVNLSGYRFVALDALPERRGRLERALLEAGVLGTVLLAPEGLNVALAGTPDACARARAAFESDPSLAGVHLKESRSEAPPFARLKVRLRDEIIAFDGPDSPARQAARPEAPRLSPETLARWLDEGRDVTLLDTRNAYEVDSGTFTGATALDIDSFRDFGDAALQALADGRLDPERPVVTFCTGGVRCEKAAPWLLEHGFREVWQIEDGVLGWFAHRGAESWKGNCFVFDERVEITPALTPSGATLCPRCQRAARPGHACPCADRDSAPGADDASSGASTDGEPSAPQGSRTAIDTV